ncbi:MAG: APC family permease [Clostridiaceae bacterium]
MYNYSKRYTIRQILFMNASACIGVGIFLLSIQVHSQFKDNGIANLVPYAFLISSIPAMLVSVISSKWSKQWPSIGGDYTYFKKIFSKPISFIVSWLYWIATPFQIQGAALVALVMISDGLKIVGLTNESNFVNSNIIILAIIIILIGFLVNFFRLEGFLAPITFTLTCILAFLFVYYTLSHNTNDYISLVSQGSLELNQLPKTNIMGFILGCSVITFSYGGITFGQHGGEECKDDFSKGITKSIVISLSICIVIYFLVSFSLYKAVPWNYIAIQAIENNDLNALNVVSLYVPNKVMAIMYFLLSITVIDNIFIIGFRAIRFAVAFSRDSIFPQKLNKPLCGGPGYITLSIYLITILITVFIHYEKLAILANFSYSLGLMFTSLMVFKIKNGEEIFGDSRRFKIFKIISIFCIIFYLINLVGIMIFLPEMTMYWAIFIVAGFFIYYFKHITNKNKYKNKINNSTNEIN